MLSEHVIYIKILTQKSHVNQRVPLKQKNSTFLPLLVWDQIHSYQSKMENPAMNNAGSFESSRLHLDLKGNNTIRIGLQVLILIVLIFNVGDKTYIESFE